MITITIPTNEKAIALWNKRARLVEKRDRLANQIRALDDQIYLLTAELEANDKQYAMARTPA